MQNIRQAISRLSNLNHKTQRYVRLAVLSVCLILLLTVSQRITSAITAPLVQFRSSQSSLRSWRQDELAFIRQISVRILGFQDSGSGVLLARQGERYTVLTNAHVVRNGMTGAPAVDYTILTADGQSHSGRWLDEVQFPDRDLAFVQFSSARSYPVVQLRRSDRLRTGETVYAAGFPNWRVISPIRLEETREEGFQALEVTTGQVKLLLPKPLEQGYQLGYTNEVAAGMSGGPVLDRRGQLVGINGGLKYPPQGIAAFTFADGTLPSVPLFEQMEALSWAIPVSTIRQSLNSQPNSHLP